MEQSQLKSILPFPSIRAQLLIISLVVLILPWIGIQTIRDMESLLRQQQVHNILTSATTIINGLEPVMPLLQSHNEKLLTTVRNSEVILSPLPDHLVIDGYADDWPENSVRQHYDSNNALRAGRSNTRIGFDLISGYHSRSLILLLDIHDDQLYQTSNPVHAPRDGDHLLLTLGNGEYNRREYIISSNSPGWLSVIPANSPGQAETRIQAEMQTRTGGYTIEIAIPDILAGSFISILAVDRDNNNQAHRAVIGNAPVTDEKATGLLFGSVAEIKRQLASYQMLNQRLSLLDMRGNILAIDGDIQTPVNSDQAAQKNWLYHLYELLLLADMPADEINDTIYRLDDNYVVNALANQTDYVFSRDALGSGLLSIAVPLLIDKKPAGALVIQQSTEAITIVRHRALFKIIFTTLAAMGVVIFVLLLYATILIKRIRVLNQQVQHVANDDGRLHQGIRVSPLDDEIGELNRGIAKMVERLQAYQGYLESMASKLSHELRTPLTVVQSSLENLQNESDDLHNNPLIERANNGLARLKTILANLTEASRLENALQSTDIESFDLPMVIESCVSGYQQAFREITFKFSSNTDRYVMQGSGDLIAQLLDKLIANAIDFHLPQSMIRVIINESETGCELCVHNSGQPVPENIKNTLFDSMISARGSTTDTPHMGLGLYIVRLIANFHGGTATINNDNDGVNVCVFFYAKNNAGLR